MQWKFDAVYKITAEFDDPVRETLGLTGARRQTLLLRVFLLNEQYGPMFTDLDKKIGFELSPSLIKSVQPMRKKLFGGWVEDGPKIGL